MRKTSRLLILSIVFLRQLSQILGYRRQLSQILGYRYFQVNDMGDADLLDNGTNRSTRHAGQNLHFGTKSDVWTKVDVKSADEEGSIPLSWIGYVSGTNGTEDQVKDIIKQYETVEEISGKETALIEEDLKRLFGEEKAEDKRTTLLGVLKKVKHNYYQSDSKLGLALMHAFESVEPNEAEAMVWYFIGKYKEIFTDVKMGVLTFFDAEVMEIFECSFEGFGVLFTNVFSWLRTWYESLFGTLDVKASGLPAKILPYFWALAPRGEPKDALTLLRGVARQALKMRVSMPMQGKDRIEKVTFKMLVKNNVGPERMAKYFEKMSGKLFKEQGSRLLFFIRKAFCEDFSKARHEFCPSIWKKIWKAFKGMFRKKKEVQVVPPLSKT